MASAPPPKVVFFDLDDTLFDHSFSTQAGLRVLADQIPAFRVHPIDHLSRLHGRQLEALHLRVLAGELSLDQARLARFAALCRDCGADGVPVGDVADIYRAAYLAARRPVPGALELLTALRSRVRVGVVTNNVVDEQLGKLQALGMRDLIDILVVSEEAGVTKPDPAIFRIALDRAGSLLPEQAVMVGDSWAVDIAGARAAGLRAVWLNREALPNPDPGSCAELRALTPTAAVVDLLLPTTPCC